MCSQIVANDKGITVRTALKLTFAIETPAPSSASFHPKKINLGRANHFEGSLITSTSGSKLISGLSVSLKISLISRTISQV